MMGWGKVRFGKVWYGVARWATASGQVIKFRKGVKQMKVLKEIMKFKVCRNSQKQN